MRQSLPTWTWTDRPPAVWWQASCPESPSLSSPQWDGKHFVTKEGTPWPCTQFQRAWSWNSIYVITRQGQRQVRGLLHSTVGLWCLVDVRADLNGPIVLLVSFHEDFRGVFDVTIAAKRLWHSRRVETSKSRSDSIYNSVDVRVEHSNARMGVCTDDLCSFQWTVRQRAVQESSVQYWKTNDRITVIWRKQRKRQSYNSFSIW
jgi:hypothetical protein